MFGVLDQCIAEFLYCRLEIQTNLIHPKKIYLHVIAPLPPLPVERIQVLIVKLTLNFLSILPIHPFLSSVFFSLHLQKLIFRFGHLHQTSTMLNYGIYIKTKQQTLYQPPHGQILPLPTLFHSLRQAARFSLSPCPRNQFRHRRLPFSLNQ